MFPKDDYTTFCSPDSVVSVLMEVFKGEADFQTEYRALFKRRAKHRLAQETRPLVAPSPKSPELANSEVIYQARATPPAMDSSDKQVLQHQTYTQVGRQPGVASVTLQSVLICQPQTGEEQLGMDKALDDILQADGDTQLMKELQRHMVPKK